MTHTICVNYKNVQLRPLHKDDLEFLRTWRNDTQFTKFLPPMQEITPEMQQSWFEKECANEDSCTFAIDESETLKRFVGSVGLFNFHDTTSKCGHFLIGDKETQGKGVGFLAMTLCLYVGFEIFKLKTITANVHEKNITALKTDQKSGFIICGKHPYIHGGYEMELIAEREHFYKLHGFLQDIKNQ